MDYFLPPPLQLFLLPSRLPTDFDKALTRFQSVLAMCLAMLGRTWGFFCLLLPSGGIAGNGAASQTCSASR